MTQTTTGTGDQVKDKAGEVAGQAQEKAQQAAGQARDQVRSQIDQRSTQAGEQVRTQGGDLRAVGESLREQGKDGPAKLAEQAADRADRVGSWLTESDADQILHDIEDTARKNPWAVVAGGIALGFAASRFLKASSTERYRSRSGSAGTSGGYDRGRGYGTGAATAGLAPPSGSDQQSLGTDAGFGTTGPGFAPRGGDEVVSTVSDEPIGRPPHTGDR